MSVHISSQRDMRQVLLGHISPGSKECIALAKYKIIEKIEKKKPRRIKKSERRKGTAGHQGGIPNLVIFLFFTCNLTYVQGSVDSCLS